MLGSIIHCYILNICGFRDEDFLSFSHNKSVGAIDPQGVASFDPRGLISRIYVGDTRHCYILNTGLTLAQNLL